MYGALDMDSMPPATATSRSPARTAWSTMPAARMPDAQTLFTVSDETSLGMPPLICAWREGTWPWPACSTCPKTTCWTSSGLTSDALERVLDDVAAQVGGVLGGQCAAHLPERGAGGAEDHGLGHGGLRLLRRGRNGAADVTGRDLRSRGFFYREALACAVAERLPALSTATSESAVARGPELLAHAHRVVTGLARLAEGAHLHVAHALLARAALLAAPGTSCPCACPRCASRS